METDMKKLRKLQLRELDILKDVTNIIDNMGLKYYLSAGTLLGAVRHGGFVPWDDDVDIMMLRQDYEKFVREGSKYLSKNYKLCHYSIFNDKKIRSEERNIITNSMIAMRIEDKRYSVIRQLWGVKVKQKVWIDIAVLDYVPETKVGFQLYKLRLKTLHTIIKVYRLEYKAKEHKSRSKIADIALAINNKIHFARLIDSVKLVKKTDHILKNASLKNSRMLINYAGEYKFKEMFPASCLGKDTYLWFENVQLRVPEDYKQYLIIVYGNYMELPPEEKRVCKHIIDVD